MRPSDVSTASPCLLQVFLTGFDHSYAFRTDFDAPFTARFVRVYPLSDSDHHLQVELLGRPSLGAYNSDAAG